MLQEIDFELSSNTHFLVYELISSLKDLKKEIMHTEDALKYLSEKDGRFSLAKNDLTERLERLNLTKQQLEKSLYKIRPSWKQ
jgi:hypothetical protein